MQDFNTQWMHQLMSVLASTSMVSPRGQKTYERLQSTVTYDMRRSVLIEPARKLSYKYMTAEAYWILKGDNTVKGIEPFNPNIASFSDDGITFFGAYGPPIMAQLPYVIGKLFMDRDSRQAGLTIWRQSPPQTKDVPCTIAMFFMIRNNQLHLSVYMRSSDVWLGLPYDAFAFSMVGQYVCALYNESVIEPQLTITPGSVSITAASSHLYDVNFDNALRVVDSGDTRTSPESPPNLYSSTSALLHILDILRHSKPGDIYRWWEE